MMPVMMVLIGVMFVVMLMKELQNAFGKKKDKMVELPRDSYERLNKAYKSGVKGKLNKDRMRHRLWISGDEYIQGYKIGDIMGIQPKNEMIKMHIKSKWWYFWQKATPLYIDNLLCTDLNCRDIVVEARGFAPHTIGVIFPIPRTNTKNLEAITIGRNNFLLSEILIQSMHDINEDSDILMKNAMRGNMLHAMREIGMYGEVPTLEEKELIRTQRKSVKSGLKESEN